MVGCGVVLGFSMLNQYMYDYKVYDWYVLASVTRMCYNYVVSPKTTSLGHTDIPTILQARATHSSSS